MWLLSEAARALGLLLFIVWWTWPHAAHEETSASLTQVRYADAATGTVSVGPAASTA